MLISTSFLSSMNPARDLKLLNETDTDYIHVDVMDGIFVPGRTMPFKEMRKIYKYTSKRLDVHLMVEDVKKGIEDFIAVEPNIITFHYEACKNKEEVFEMINLIKDNHCKVGISIKPETDVSEIFEFLPYIHVCLVMTVEPGKGGQTLLTDMVVKISKLKKYIEENNIEIDIEADGGINLKTADYVKNAGANILVSGTAILIAKDYKTIIDELKR